MTIVEGKDRQTETDKSFPHLFRWHAPPVKGRWVRSLIGAVRDRHDGARGAPQGMHQGFFRTGPRLSTPQPLLPLFICGFGECGSEWANIWQGGRANEASRGPDPFFFFFSTRGLSRRSVRSLPFDFTRSSPRAPFTYFSFCVCRRNRRTCPALFLPPVREVRRAPLPEFTCESGDAALCSLSAQAQCMNSGSTALQPVDAFESIPLSKAVLVQRFACPCGAASNPSTPSGSKFWVPPHDAMLSSTFVFHFGAFSFDVPSWLGRHFRRHETHG